MASARGGRTRTLSISVDAATEKILKEEAAAHFDGNVSQLVAALAREARRKAAVARIAEWSGYGKLSREDREALEREIQDELAPQKRRKRRTAA